ncbi:MAG: CBS domain-containing protein [Promethearchaeota archaeon]
MERNNDVLLTEIVNRRPVTTRRGMSVRDAALKVMEHHSSFLIVIDDDDDRRVPIGIFTERDFMNMIGYGIDTEVTRIESVMVHPLITLESTCTIGACQDLMQKNGIKHVVVLEGEELLGVITLKELLIAKPTLIVETHPVVLYAINKSNGLLIFEYDFLQKGSDSTFHGDLFTGTMNAIDTLLPKILGSKGGLKVIEIADFKIIIEHGDFAIFIVIQDKESIDSRRRLKAFKKKFESRFADILSTYTENVPINVFDDGKRIIEQIYASKMKNE